MRIIDLSTGFTSNSAPVVTAQLIKHNYAATTSPTINEDTGDGYQVGSNWINITLDKAFICVDATLAAAKWRRIDMIPLKVTSQALIDMSSTNISSATYVELVASSVGIIKKIQATYQDGDPLILATGAAASEVSLCYIPAGGTDSGVEVDIPAGTRISVKIVAGGATNVSDYLAINFLGEA